MPDLMLALRNADAAGDKEAAQRIAGMIQAQKAATQPQAIQEVQPEIQQSQFNPMKDMSLFGVTGEDIAGAANLGQNIVTGIVAKPVAGLVGLKDVAEGEGLKGAETVERVTEDIQTPLSGSGKSFAGKLGESLQSLAEIPGIDELIKNSKSAAEFVQKAGERVGGLVADPIGTITGTDVSGNKQTGQAIGSALGKAIPETAIEVAMMKGVGSKPSTVRAPIKAVEKVKGIDKALSEAAPTVEKLTDEARKIYKKVDDLGVSIKKNVYSSFADDVSKTLDDMGVDSIISPKANRAMERVLKVSGDSVKVSELEKLRKIAQQAAKSIEGSDKAMGTVLIKKIDNFLDNLKPTQTEGGNTGDVGVLLREARGMWSRASKGEKVADMINVAENYQSGFESGLRNQATSLLKSKKNLKGFSKDEIKALQQISRGGSLENTMKFIGKFGIGEKQQTGALMSLLGAGAGGATMGFGGMVVLPAIGTVSGKIALKLTKGNAKYLDDLVRAGKDSKKITATYLKNTPKENRSVAELTELLMRPDVSLKNISSQNQTVNDALWLTNNYSKKQLMSILGLTGKELENTANE
jgi:hypothetical protein